VIYLGIDGGGSKTKFLLVDDALHEISRSQSGPSNYLSVGKEAATAAIRQGSLALKGLVPDVVCGGFAGAGRREGLEFYRGILEQLYPSSRVQIETDAVISYAGAVGLQPGVLLIAGTGSIAIGRRPDGTMIRAGGWGPHFGDEGGGFWIGREAVRVGLRSLDSGSDPEFARTMAAKLGVNSLPDVVSHWAAGTIGVPDIAALFPAVVELWPAEPAAGILRSAASQLKTLVETAVSRVAVPSSAVCLSGSVAMHPVIRNLIGLHFDEPKASPEEGAILLVSQV
jgi:N-acetylglucosamine kinase-like BadF-type ATPase